MWQNLNKWTLPVVVAVVSVMSISLIYRLVQAQFFPPSTLPGDPIDLSLTLNPMVEDVDLGGYSFIDNTADLGTKLGLIDVNTAVTGKSAIYADFRGTAGGYAIFARNHTGTDAVAYFDANGTGSGRLAGYFNGDVEITGDLTVGGSGGGGGGNDQFWLYSSSGTGSIHYSTTTADEHVGIGTSNADHTLVLSTSGSTSNAELNLQTNAHNYWAMYHDNVSEDLRFWNADASPEQNVLTLQNNGMVGIGIPDTYDPTARLEVRNRGSEDILNLYDDTTRVLAVADGGHTTLTNGNFTATNGNVLLTNGRLGIGATDPGYKLNVVATPATQGVRSTGGQVGFYGEGSFAGIFGVATGAGSSAGYFSGPVWMADGNTSISVSSTGINLNTIGSNINFNSNANVNFASHVTQSTGYYSMRRSSIPPTATDCDGNLEQGRIYLNYANDRLYVCSGSPVPAWKYILLIP